MSEADAIIDPAHPALTDVIYGHEDAQENITQALGRDDLHHAWLITGPKGIGKATIAWRMAQAILHRPAQTGGLFGDELPPENPFLHSFDDAQRRRMINGAEARFFHLICSKDEKTGRLRTQITVDDVRKLKKFFGLSATDGGWRVVLVDAADDMNISAANALLKLLEEPPARVVLILLSHSPAKLLPTIRSRCRILRLSPLNASALEAALLQTGSEVAGDLAPLCSLAAGSVGLAHQLIAQNGLALYAQMIDLISTMPRLDRSKAGALADKLSAKGNEVQLDLFFNLLDVVFSRLARMGALGADVDEIATDESATFRKLSPSPDAGRAWAELAHQSSKRVDHARAVNLDPAALILDTFWKMQDIAHTTKL